MTTIPPVAGALKFAPALAFVFTDGQSRRVKAGPHDEAFRSVRIDHPVNRRHLPAGFPTLRRGQTVAPRQPAVRAALVNNATPTVALGIDDQHRLVVLQQHRGWVAEVLALFAIDDDLAMGLFRQVDRRDRVALWLPFFLR